MTLSTQTFHNLADALVNEVEEYIQSDQRFADFMYEIISDAIQNKLGELDGQVLGELTCLLIERLYLTHSINIPKGCS